MAVTNSGVCSEYGRLTAVLLHKPGEEIVFCAEPAAVHHLHPIDPAVMSREYDSILNTYARLGVEVVRLDSTPLNSDRNYLYNLMYCRDLFFMTPAGAIIGSMANKVRREEVLYAQRTLEALGVPILHAIEGEGLFEGADALWINERLVAVGIGNRTNMAAFAQLEAVLEQQGVTTVSLPSHQTRTQHLLGTVQIVDRNLALVRYEIIDPELIRFLKANGFAIVAIPENHEVMARQAMNIITIAPRTIVMTAGCPDTKRLYLNAGLKVAAEIEISQLINGAGGLACATGIIARA
jgi:N-dimethylarginine dimethylaminohydrolase